MSFEMNESNEKITPLSKAQVNRRNNNTVNITEEKLKEVLSSVIDNKLEIQNQALVVRLSRIENSINRMVQQFESIRSGESKDAALRVTTESDAADLALASTLPSEDLYPYTCSMLGEKLGVRNHDITQMIKSLNLRGNGKYHYIFKTGSKSSIPKWSEETYLKLKKELDSNEYKSAKPRPIIETIHL